VLDDRWIAEQTGFERTWHEGQPSDPIIVADKRWERWPHLFGSVLFDPEHKLYRMWYEALNGFKPQTLETLLLYAESSDGLRWTKPALGVHETGGSKANNVVWPKAELACVFLDPRPDRTHKFKMVAWDNGLGVPHGRFRAFGSNDGTHWTPLADVLPETLVDPAERIDGIRCDTNIVTWDDVGKRYLATYRTFPRHALGFYENRRRAVGVTTSTHLLTGWKPIVTVLRADDEDDSRVRALHPEAKQAWAELYAMPVFPYGNHYLGLLSLLDFVDGKDTVPGTGNLQLAFSHDGFAWQRPAGRKPLVERDASSTLIPTCAACSPPIRRGDELWIYYSESDSAHPGPGQKSQIRVARWRSHGFASLDAAGTGATLLTAPLVFSGRKLLVNFKPSKDGQLRAALVDDKGSVIAGFETEKCDPFRGDATGHALTWAGKGDLKALAGKPVRLRLTVDRGSVYSFRFGA